MRLWNLRSRQARRISSIITIFGFRKANFVFFMDLVDRIPWETAMESKRPWESWLIFKENLDAGGASC